MKNPIYSYARPSALVLALGLALGLGVQASADVPAGAVTGTAEASAPASPTAAVQAATPAPTPQVYTDYPAFLSATVAALGSPLAVFLAQSGQPGLSVAAGGFRELVTGERSPFCDNLDKDLSNRLRDDTPYGVPSTQELADAWVAIGGSSVDLDQPYTLARFGRVLGIQAVLGGDYLVRGGVITVHLRLMRCSDGSVAWSGEELLSPMALARGDLQTYSGSAPPGWGASLTAPPPSPSVAPAPGVSVVPGASPTPAAESAALTRENEASQSGVSLENDVYETEFSIYRVDFGAGYEFQDPTNPQFRSVAPHLSSPYVEADWADIARAEFFLWYQPSALSPQEPISNLFGYGMEGTLALPVRLGHYWVVYGGVGGRFETIVVDSPALPSGDGVSFGNNSLFFTVGAKAHIHSLGLEASASYGPQGLSDQTNYFMARLGTYYEWNFQ